MGYGVTLRPKPRVQVLRGYNPMDPATLTATAAPGGDDILSGQLLQKVWDGASGKYVFELYDGTAAGVLTNGVPYVSWSDYSASDGLKDQDVIESGKITALSSAGNFEIQTAFFDDGGTYNEGTALTADEGTPGNVRPAAAGENIIGYVTQVRGATEIKGIEAQSTEYQKLDPANKVWEDSKTTAANSKVIAFQTAFAGATA